MWYGMMGFLFPIVGWIYWLCKRMENPEAANEACIGACVGFVFWGLMLH